jgi:predicted lipase
MPLINDTNKISSDVSSSILGELGSMGLPMSTASQRLGHYSSLLNRDAMLSQQRLDYLQSVYNERMKQLKDAINQQTIANSINALTGLAGTYFANKQPEVKIGNMSGANEPTTNQPPHNPNLPNYASSEMNWLNYMYGQGGYNSNTQDLQGILNTFPIY